MNLKNSRGKIPIQNPYEHEATPYLYLEFPIGKEFDALYPRIKEQATKDRYYLILRERTRGKTLEESGKMFGVSKARVRQIEAKFLRLMRQKYAESLNYDLLKLTCVSIESFSDFERL